MNRFWIISIIFGLVPCMDLAADEPKAPSTVKELFSDFDPRKDPFDTKVVREWQKDGIVYRYVTFHIGNFKGEPARMAAFTRRSAANQTDHDLKRFQRDALPVASWHLALPVEPSPRPANPPPAASRRTSC